MLMKTEYFVGTLAAWDSVEITIQSAIEKRDKFLSENANTIGRIVSEDMQCVGQQNVAQFRALITLCYYIKES